MKVKLRLDLEDIKRDVFEVTSCQRAWIPTEIDGEIYSIEYGIKITEQVSTGGFFVNEIWIEQLENAPDFELTKKMKKQIEEAILTADEGDNGKILWEGH